MDGIPGLFISLWLVAVVHGDKWTRGDPAFDNLLRPDGSDFHVRSLLECGKACALVGPCSGFSHSKSHKLCQLHEGSLPLEYNVSMPTMRFYERRQGPAVTDTTQTSTTPTIVSTMAPTATTLPTTTPAKTTTTLPTTTTDMTTTTLPTTLSMTTTTTAPPTTTSASSTTTATCPSLDAVKSVEFPDGALYSIAISQIGHTKSAAYDHCISYGATLAKIDTNDKQNTLSNMLNSCPGLAGTSYWIDGERNNIGQWVYADLTAMSLDDSTLWASGSPRMPGPGLEDCVIMRASMSYRWDNAGCSESHGVICLKRLTVVQPIANFDAM